MFDQNANPLDDEKVMSLVRRARAEMGKTFTAVFEAAKKGDLEGCIAARQRRSVLVELQWELEQFASEPAREQLRRELEEEAAA